MRGRRLACALAIAAAIAAAGCGLARTSASERARAAWAEQDYKAAAAAYEEYLAGAQPGPEAEEAEFALADIYNHNLKQYDRARDHYATFLEKYPTSEHAYDARERLAEVHTELKALPEAIADYEQLLEEHPDTPERRKVRATIADLYFQRNDFRQAELEYDRVVENAPYDDITEQALLRLASISHLIRGQEERAIPAYERVVESTDDPAVRRTALYSLSEVYATLFRYDDAIATLKRIDEPSEADYVARRTAELERQKREHAEAPEVDWSRGRGEGN
jgi:tetratricopeptide (TPR) repeat protein